MRILGAAAQELQMQSDVYATVENRRWRARRQVEGLRRDDGGVGARWRAGEGVSRVGSARSQETFRGEKAGRGRTINNT